MILLIIKLFIVRFGLVTTRAHVKPLLCPKRYSAAMVVPQFNLMVSYSLFTASKHLDDIVKEVSTPPPTSPEPEGKETPILNSKEYEKFSWFVYSSLLACSSADADRVLPLYASISPKKLLIMSFATWGVYTIYWDWCQWNAIRNRTGQKLSPVDQNEFFFFFFLLFFFALLMLFTILLGMESDF